MTQASFDMWVLQCVVMCCTVLQYALEMKKPVCYSALQCVPDYLDGKCVNTHVCICIYVYMYICIYVYTYI